MSVCPKTRSGPAFLQCRHRMVRRQNVRDAHSMPDMTPTVSCELRRIPGLFRRWELAQVLKPGKDYHLEDAGMTSDGTALMAVYHSVSTENEPSRQEAVA